LGITDVDISPVAFNLNDIWPLHNFITRANLVSCVGAFKPTPYVNHAGGNYLSASLCPKRQLKRYITIASEVQALG